MSKIVCPDCGSDNVMTERRPDGYHICRKCCFYWRNEEATKPTLFDRITASPEVLAPHFVFLKALLVTNINPKQQWISTITDDVYSSKNEAIAATLAKLKEVAE